VGGWAVGADGWYEVRERDDILSGHVNGCACVKTFLCSAPHTLYLLPLFCTFQCVCGWQDIKLISRGRINKFPPPIHRGTACQVAIT